MRLIIFFLLLNSSTAAFAHAVTANPDTLSNRLHVLLSVHHLPMLLLCAALLAVFVVTGLVARGARSRDQRRHRR